MSRLFAISTSDPSLLRCELDRATPLVSLDGDGLALGLGAYEDLQLVQRRYGVGVTRTDLWALEPSQTVVVHAGSPPLGQQVEDMAQPFRWRQWLFVQEGAIARAQAVRERLTEQLPDFLQQSLKGPSLEEAVFATFLAELRGLGRIEDPDLEAPLAGQLLARTASHVQLAAGPSQRVPLALVATNGRVLVATVNGAQPLFYSLLEGDAVCRRCELSGTEKTVIPLVRDHVRRRSVLLATHPVKSDGWQPVPEGRALSVGRSLELQVG